MAFKQASQNVTVNMWNSRTFFPKDNYILRVIDQENKTSSTDNPMTVLEWEIINCAPKVIGDKTYDMEGVKFKSYHVTRVNGDEEKSNKMFGYFDELLKSCGVDTSNGWDDENPPSVEGVKVHACVQGDEQKNYASPTPEERAAGKKVGAVLKDPITGKDVVFWAPKLVQVYGLFTGDGASAV